MTATAILPSLSSAPGVSPGDRLGLTFFFALVAHAIVILGVSFAPTDTPRINRNTMEIILVPTRAQKSPEKAEYLAQANQDGGGESDKKERPSTPVAAPLIATRAKLASATPPVPPENPTPRKKSPEKPVLARTETKSQLPTRQVQESETAPTEETNPRPKTNPQLKATPNVDAATLVTRSLEMASLNAELNKRLTAYAERPRHKFINARTQEYKYAAYMEAWRAKVERVGNLNYPDAARRRKLSGNLLLDVALKPDGSVQDIVLRRSSGKKVLDDAAIRIVELAAPFAPFPKDIREETDILHVERTWQFLSTNRLYAR